MFRTIIAVLGCVVCLSPAYAQDKATTSSGWYWRFGQSPSLENNEGGGFRWWFPKGGSATNDIDYLLTNNVSGVQVGRWFHVKYETWKYDGGNVMGSNDGCTTPSARVIIRKQNDGALTDPDGRWWAYAHPIWTNWQGSQGTFEIWVEIKPSNFTNVFGANGSTRVSQFNTALANVGEIGLTFGDCNFFGHGEKLRGDVGGAKGRLIRFRLID